MTDLVPLIRAPDGTGEWNLVRETCCRVRQPRRDGEDIIPWAAWEPMYMPRVLEASAVVQVAVLEGVVVGFVVVDAWWRVFMLYVKREYRGNGFGVRLLDKTLPRGMTTRIHVTADMLTPTWRRWCRDKGLAWELPNGEAR